MYINIINNKSVKFVALVSAKKKRAATDETVSPKCLIFIFPYLKYLELDRN